MRKVNYLSQFVCRLLCCPRHEPHRFSMSLISAHPRASPSLLPGVNHLTKYIFISMLCDVVVYRFLFSPPCFYVTPFLPLHASVSVMMMVMASFFLAQLLISTSLTG